MSTETKTYTLEEIAEHHDKKSSWILIHGSVYDITRFLEEVNKNIKLLVSSED